MAEEKKIEIETETETETEKRKEKEEGVGQEVELPGDVETLCRMLDEEKQKAAEHYDQWLRAVAELRNYKKRVEQEREQLVREANAGLIAQLLPILDDFDRAMCALPDEKLLQFSWIEGIMLIYRRLRAVLEQHGLRPIEACGQPFDPRCHEAVLFEEGPAEQDQIVLSELQKGYKLHDRLLRPALVKVCKGTGPAKEEGTPKS